MNPRGRLKTSHELNASSLRLKIFQTTSSHPAHTELKIYSGLTFNQYGVASPCRTICTVCGFVALS
ncbi:hypothetical protein [Neisseria sicca]